MEGQETVFDKIMYTVGDDGPFQRRFNYIFNVGLVLCASMAYMNIILALDVPDHWCYVPGRNMTNYTIEKWKNITLPREIDNMGINSYSSCKMYNINTTIIQEGIDYLDINNTDYNISSCIYGFEFDKEWYERTAVTQQNWVCERELYVTNTFVFNRIGEVVGTFVFGQLGDTLGRRVIFYISLLTVFFGRFLAIITSGNFFFFSIASIVGSVTSNSVFQSPLIIAMETSKGEDRAHIAMMQSIGWTAGLCIMPLVYWWTRDWIWFLTITTAPCILFVGFSKYMIESPRWLANKGYFAKCAVELQKIAKINGKNITFTEKQLRELMPNAKVETVYGIMSLFSGWRLAKNTILLVICWITGSLLYFTLILNASRMGGNPFLNFLWQSAIEMPAYVLGRSWGNKYGRRYTTVLSFFLAAFASFALVFFISNPNMTTVSSIIAVIIKFSISITFFVVNLLSMETYPTCLRQTGISIGSISANAVGVLGPYIVYLGTNFDIRYPYIIMTVICAIGGLSGLFLPETLYQKLPETLAEAQIFGADQPFWSMPRPPKSIPADESDNEEEELTMKLNQKEFAL